MHYWCGYTNYVRNSYNKYFKNFILIKDNIKLDEDQGNNIPLNSWMLYLLEVFNNQQVPVELNLICQFDDQNYFEAIFNGYNQYRFRKVIPQVGHTYERQIIFEWEKSSLTYILNDVDSLEKERYCLKVNNSFKYEFFQSFSGVEWWNKKEASPYPVRFKAQIFNLMYGLNDDTNDPESILLFPINRLNTSTDGKKMKYPVKFQTMEPINQCFHYIISS